MGAGYYERGRTWHEEDGPDPNVERYRAWISAKLFQGLGLVAVLIVAVFVFDSL